MYPSTLALCSSAVSKSWLSLVQGRLDESRHHLFYRIDAAEAEKVRKKIRTAAVLRIRGPKSRIYSRASEDFSVTASPCSIVDRASCGAELIRSEIWPHRPRPSGKRLGVLEIGRAAPAASFSERLHPFRLRLERRVGLQLRDKQQRSRQKTG